ncbi:zinc finger C2HC domain-containing protein 1C-like isoform X2 [Gigantopelta aegis]|nr:zinc finger C2HC domain-containing protein 1C-like isoform X2 [Gigantopelta aegis]
MNQIAMPSQSNYRDKSPSRIPRFSRDTAAVVDRGPDRAKRPSRLELLQVEYQKQILKQKEEKMLLMYEDNQRRALEKVSRQNSSSSNRSTPSVRDFFYERRKMESKGFFSPPIDQHYKQLRSGMSFPSNGEWSRKGSANSSVSSYSKGSSAGRDRSCLLQPISTSPGIAGSPTKPKPKPVSYVRYDSNGRILNGANAGHRSRIRPPESSSSSSDNSPPPNLASLKNNKKLTDFQKWKMEQDMAREERLRRHQKINSDAGRWDREEDQANGQEEEEGDAEEEPEEEPVREAEEEEAASDSEETVDVDRAIARRQEEILAQIEQQERELEQLRQERLQKEDRARIAVEREAEKEEKRKQRIEQEKKLLAMEREKQMKKDEEEAHKRQMKEEEEEKRQKRAQDKRRALSHHQKEWKRANPSHDQQDDNTNHYTPSSSPPPEERTPTPDEQYTSSGAGLDLYLQAADEEGAQGGAGSLVPCKLCGRRFAADRVAKHQSACRNISKKRKVFDPVKMRTAGTEMSKYVHNSDKQQTPQKKNNWKVKHDNFIESIRYAKKLTQMEASGDTRNIGPAPKLDTSDLVPCPHCGRKFAASTAEQHIPKCVLLKTKPVKQRK